MEKEKKVDNHEWQGRRPAQVETSEKLVFWAWVGLAVTLVACCLWGCGDTGRYRDQVLQVRVDSVEYRGVGRDNTLQLEPYWKVWTDSPKMVFRSSRLLEVGDSIPVVIRKWDPLK